MNCRQVSAKGYCDYSTNIGHIGDDLCPASCDRCPAKPASGGSRSGSFKDPTPVRTHGLKSGGSGRPVALPETEQDRRAEKAAEETAEEKAEEEKEVEDEKK